jgi:hypothetical protein
MSEFALTPEQRKRLRAKPRKAGYAHTPGSGPHGETCGTCKHKRAKEMSKTYYKCDLRRSTWTSGYGTDILLKSPACKFWER